MVVLVTYCFVAVLPLHLVNGIMIGLGWPLASSLVRLGVTASGSTFPAKRQRRQLSRCRAQAVVGAALSRRLCRRGPAVRT